LTFKAEADLHAAVVNIQFNKRLRASFAPVEVALQMVVLGTLQLKGTAGIGAMRRKLLAVAQHLGVSASKGAMLAASDHAKAAMRKDDALEMRLALAGAGAQELCLDLLTAHPVADKFVNLAFDRVELDKVLENVSNLISEKAVEKRLELIFDIEPSVISTRLRGDPLGMITSASRSIPTNCLASCSAGPGVRMSTLDRRHSMDPDAGAQDCWH
jgi:hypothetical protein